MTWRQRMSVEKRGRIREALLSFHQAAHSILVAALLGRSLRTPPIICCWEAAVRNSRRQAEHLYYPHERTPPSRFSKSRSRALKF